MANSQPDDLAEHGLGLFGQGGAVFSLDGAEVAVDQADGELADPDVAQRGQDVFVKAVAVGGDSGGGAVLPAEVGEPHLGHDGELGVGVISAAASMRARSRRASERAFSAAARDRPTRWTSRMTPS